MNKKTEKTTSKANYYDETAANLYAEKVNHGYKSFGFCGCNAKVGTTTVSKKLAENLARAGWKTIWIDADFHKANREALAKKGVRRSGISEFAKHKATVKEIIVNAGRPNLSLIESGYPSPEDEGSVLCSGKVEQLLAELYTTHDFILVDVPSLDCYPDAKVICSGVDAVVLVVALEETTKRQLETAKAQMEEADISVAGVVITKDRQSGK